MRAMYQASPCRQSIPLARVSVMTRKLMVALCFLFCGPCLIGAAGAWWPFDLSLANCWATGVLCGGDGCCCFELLPAMGCLQLLH